MKKLCLCALISVFLLTGACSSTSDQQAETSSSSPAPSPSSSEIKDESESSDKAETSQSPKAAETQTHIDPDALDEDSIGSPDLPAENVALFKPNQAAPDFSALNRDGESVSLSNYAGRTLVLNFWASWCGPCASEMPELNELDKKWMRGNSVEILTVNMTDGSGETKQSAIDFLDEFSYGFNVVFDTDGNIAYDYLVSSIPTTYIIKPDGDLYCIIIGQTTADVIETLLGNIE